MSFIFEMLGEIIIAPIVQGYAFAMTLFTKKSKTLNREKIRIFVVIECILLLVLFSVGVVMLLETNGESLSGKMLLLFSVGVSFLQIIIGCILKTINKAK